MSGPMDDIKRFFSAHPDLYQFLKDLVFSLTFVAVIALALYLYAGTWSPVVSVDGTSMLDHMHAGDLVLVQGLDRGPVKTYEDSINTSYAQYGEPGDVIVYYPYGRRDLPMVIHRAIRWVNQSEPMWPDGPVAPASGYITLGRQQPEHHRPGIQHLLPAAGAPRVGPRHRPVQGPVPRLPAIAALRHFAYLIHGHSTDEARQ